MKITLLQNRFLNAAYWDELLRRLIPMLKRELTTFRFREPYRGFPLHGLERNERSYS